MKLTDSLNADPTEIAKFDALAHDWWNPSGYFKPLHDINPLRLSFIQQHVAINQKSIVDIGCGGGILTESLAKLGGKVTGIDLGAKALVIARQHAESENLKINYQQTDAQTFAKQHSEQFDIITCMELLEHVPDPVAVVAACAQLTKPGGYLFFSTINRNPKAYLYAVLGAEYLLKLLPKGTHDYKKFIRPSELDAWARQVGLHTEALAGMTYHLLTRQYQLTKNIDVNYLVCCQKQFVMPALRCAQGQAPAGIQET